MPKTKQTCADSQKLSTWLDMMLQILRDECVLRDKLQSSSDIKAYNTIIKYLEKLGINTISYSYMLDEGDSGEKIYPIHQLLVLNYFANGTDISTLNPEFIAQLDKLVVYLIGRGVNLNIEYRGMEPIHISAYYGRTEVVEAIARTGYNTYKKDANGYSALAYSLKSGSYETSKFLLEQPDAIFQLKMMPASWIDYFESLKLLSDKFREELGLYRSDKFKRLPPLPARRSYLDTVSKLSCDSDSGGTSTSFSITEDEDDSDEEPNPHDLKRSSTPALKL